MRVIFALMRSSMRAVVFPRRPCIQLVTGDLRIATEWRPRRTHTLAVDPFIIDIGGRVLAAERGMALVIDSAKHGLLVLPPVGRMRRALES